MDQWFESEVVGLQAGQAVVESQLVLSGAEAGDDFFCLLEYDNQLLDLNAGASLELASSGGGGAQVEEDGKKDGENQAQETRRRRKETEEMTS